MTANLLERRLAISLILSALGLASPAVAGGTSTDPSSRAPATTAAEQIRAPGADRSAVNNASGASSIRSSGSATSAPVVQDPASDSMGPETRSPMAVATRTTVEFNRLDADRDGGLTRSEYHEGPNFGQEFESLDKNNDATISRGEFAGEVAATK